MKNDDEIKGVLLNILQIGLLRIRVLGWNGSGDQCGVEADHLHNLPQLIQSPDAERLLYYYNIERPAFLSRTISNADQFKSSWDHLAQLIDTKKPDLDAKS